MPASKTKKLRNEVHVMPAVAMGGWVVGHRYCDKSGYATTEIVFRPTKAAAVQVGKMAAMGYRAELIVHNKDGKIAWRNSYGNDPKSRKG